ncbi:MAG: ABC transporter permease, partial [Rikenella sp.]|nr:ABC transporter permease [Rikenella sp.]
GLYVQQELAVDDFHTNKDRIFRLEYEGSTLLPPALGGALEARYPEIEAMTRVYRLWELGVEPIAGFTIGKTTGRGMFVDSSFFRIFSFPFVEGTPEAALRTQGDIVLSRRFARKLFGEQAAVGQTLRIKDREFMVCGVVDDFKRTHFESPDLLLSIDLVPPLCFGFDEPDLMSVMNGCYDFSTYVLGREHTDLAARLDTAELNRAFLDVFQLALFQTGNKRSPRLCPLKEIYLNPVVGRASRSNTWTYLLVLQVVAGAILFFAVINYINLSVAQSGFRAKEAATRRLLGGSRGSLFGGFVLESIIICFASLVLGLLAAATVEPWFREMMQTDISIRESLTAGNIALALGGVLVIGIVSGLVPAYVLTRFKPIDVVRGTFRRQTKMVYSKILIAFQYCITIVLIGCTITIGRQIDFMCHSDLGFESEQVIVCTNPFNGSQQEGIRNELMSIPGVMAVSFASAAPGVGTHNGYYGHFDTEGKLHDLRGFDGDTAFLTVLGIRPTQETGRRGPNGRQVWLTDAAWRDLELADDAIEYTRAENERHRFVITGRLRDFHIDDFSEQIDPVLVSLEPGYVGRKILIRVTGGQNFAAMDRIAEVYGLHGKESDFDGHFLQQDIDNQYRTQKRMAQIITSFALLAILISALGMLAMSTYFMRQRAQEVAVRKVFGAMNREVLGQLMASFLRLVLVAFVVAVPAIWYFMREWLAGYAYRISLSWTIFALAGLAAFVIAFLTVLWQALKATLANPIHAIHE